MTAGIFIIASANQNESNDFKENSYLVQKQSIFYTLNFFIIINRKIWPLKIVSRDSLFALTSKDILITINDTNYVNTKNWNTIKFAQ